MRLIFFGTPDFAARCLEKALRSRHQVVAVVTAPDKPKGRGRKVEPSEVKLLAQRQGLEILQPEKLKEPSFIARLALYNADLFCVVAFRILPEEIFTMPPRGCINLHASLLPKYRGAAPINWAIINGEKETGLTTFFIRQKVDTGNIILQEKIEIGSEETFGELHDRMADLGGELLIRTIDLIESGEFKPLIQDNSQASPAPKLAPEIEKLDWAKTAVEIHNLVRGLSPKPGTFTYNGDRKLIIIRTKIFDKTQAQTEPGKIIQADPRKGLVIACGRGAVEILLVRPESGKTMSGVEYIRGYRPTVGEVLGDRIGYKQ